MSSQKVKSGSMAETQITISIVDSGKLYFYFKQIYGNGGYCALSFSAQKRNPSKFATERSNEYFVEKYRKTTEHFVEKLQNTLMLVAH